MRVKVIKMTDINNYNFRNDCVGHFFDIIKVDFDNTLGALFTLDTTELLGCNTTWTQDFFSKIWWKFDYSMHDDGFAFIFTNTKKKTIDKVINIIKQKGGEILRESHDEYHTLLYTTLYDKNVIYDIEKIVDECEGQKTLKDKWQINSFNHPASSRKKYFFCQKEDANITIDIVAPTEEEAWGRLGTLLGKDDKESEVFEGVVNVYTIGDFLIGDIESESRKTFTDYLVEHEGKRIKVTMEIEE